MREVEPAPDGRGDHVDRAGALRAGPARPRLSQPGASRGDGGGADGRRHHARSRDRLRAPSRRGSSPTPGSRSCASSAATPRSSDSGAPIPDLGAALADLKEAPFPPSIEVVLKPGAPAGSAKEIAAAARLWPGVESSESEEEFSRRFRDAIALLRNAGLFLGAILTLAAVLSVASAVRLALDLHRDEVGIMRLMGATESAIRAPFWLYATAEGLVGGGLALGLLYATYRFATHWLARDPHPVLAVLWVGFLGLPTALLLPAAGAAAGLVGSLLSLGRRQTRSATRIA